MPVLPSYRNQSTDLQSKSIDWFPYEGNTGISWVKVKIRKKNLSENYTHFILHIRLLSIGDPII